MMAFEAAGLLILLGVFGGVFAARPGKHTAARDRLRLEAASAAGPEPIAPEAPLVEARLPDEAHAAPSHHGHGERA